MAIPPQLVYQGDKKEFQFRDAFVMPLLIRLGFGVVVNYHGQREFGRDVIFGDVDRFGHVVYYGMQIKYESSISLGDSHSLIQDAEQATHNPFKHPQTGREEFISCFYVANAGDISEQASALSGLDFGVEFFEFDAGVFELEVPVDATLFGVGFF